MFCFLEWRGHSMLFFKIIFWYTYCKLYTFWMQKSTRYDVCGRRNHKLNMIIFPVWGVLYVGNSSNNFGFENIFSNLSTMMNNVFINLLANHCLDLGLTPLHLLPPFGRQSIYFNRNIGNQWVGGRVTMQLGRGFLPMIPPKTNIAAETWCLE